MNRKELLEYIKEFIKMYGDTVPTAAQLAPLLEVVEANVKVLRQEEYERLASLLAGVASPEVDVQEPWTGVSLEELWDKNTDDLIFGLRRDIVKLAVAGVGVYVLHNALRKRFNTEHRQTKTIVITEGTRVFNEARLLNKTSTGQYQFLASPSERTCSVCSSLDLKVFSVDNRQPGINFPPLHPNCRCTVVPVVDGQAVEDARWVEKGFNYDAWKEWNQLK